MTESRQFNVYEVVDVETVSVSSPKKNSSYVPRFKFSYSWRPIKVKGSSKINGARISIVKVFYVQHAITKGTLA